MINLNKHLDNLSRIDFSDAAPSPMTQLGAGMKEIFDEFSLAAMSLWTCDNQLESIRLELFESRLDMDITDYLGLGERPEISLADIPDVHKNLLVTKTAILSSELSPEAQAQLNERRPEEMADKELLIFPIHSALGIEGIIVCRAETVFAGWNDERFAALLNNILCFGNAYLSICHSQVIQQLSNQNDLLNEIEHLAHVGGWQYEVATEELYWTAETYRIYGLEPSNAVNPDQGISHYSGESEREIREAFENAVGKGTPYEKELRFNDAQGNSKWIRTTGKPRYDGDKISHVYGAFEDITREKNLIDFEKNATAYFEGILNNLSDAVITIDSRGIIKTANQAVKKIFGYSQTEMLGRDIAMLMPDPYQAMHQRYMKSYLKTGNSKIIGVGRELPAMRRNGDEFPMELSLSEVVQNGERIFIGIIRDISERKEAEDKLYRMAFFDELTKLPNRSSFERDLLELLLNAQQDKQCIYAGLIDIDRFSQINLTYGKKSGDYALTMVSDRIHGMMPSNYRLYRNTADSFFVLYQQPVDGEAQDFLKAATDLCQSLLQNTSDELIINEHSHNLTVSIGSGLVPSDNLRPSKLINMLEFAVGQAKNKGGNCHSPVDQSSHAELERKALLGNLLYQALAQDEFSLVLQPQYDSTQKLVASEALIRWHSAELGFVSPAEFIPIAEKTGVIVPIGDWVLEQCCQQLHRLNEQGVHTTIAINVSAKQIIQPDFSDRLLVITNKWRVKPDQLILEITETTLISDIELVKARMLYLSKLGLRFSIDDFGTGYSSLSYLRQLPLHELKIDRFFVDEIDPSGTEVPIVNSIIQMAKALEVKVVAEGVENEAQMNYLSEKQCDLFQGYHLSKPLPIEQWQALLQPDSSAG